MTTKLADRVIRYLMERGLVDSFTFIIVSTLQLLRGFLPGYWSVFIGKRLTTRSRRKVRIGKSTHIEDYVAIDGFGEYGLHIRDYCKIGNFSILRIPPLPYQSGSGIYIGNY